MVLRYATAIVTSLWHWVLTVIVWICRLPRKCLQAMMLHVRTLFCLGNVIPVEILSLLAHWGKPNWICPTILVEAWALLLSVVLSQNELPYNSFTWRQVVPRTFSARTGTCAFHTSKRLAKTNCVLWWLSIPLAQGCSTTRTCCNGTTRTTSFFFPHAFGLIDPLILNNASSFP